MKASVKNCLVIVLAIIAAQVVDYVWYSGVLPWQAEANRDIAMGVIMSVILSVASCLIYGAFYDGADIRDIFEIAFMFTIVHLALDGGASSGSSSDLVNLLINGAHSFILLFVINFVQHQAKKSIKSTGGKKYK